MKFDKLGQEEHAEEEEGGEGVGRGEKRGWSDMNENIFRKSVCVFKLLFNLQY